MRIAVFSDIHGNPYAAEAVLNAIQGDGPFDAVIAAGDHCLSGSDPARCVDLLRDASVLALVGNTDEYIFAPHKTPSDEAHRVKWDEILRDVHWARERMTNEDIAWLAARPFSVRFSPTPNPADDLLVVHAHPKSLEGTIYPPVSLQTQHRGRVLQADDDPELAWMLDGVTAKTIAFGHIHLTHLREWNDYRLVCVAPCSLPTIDFDHHARFTVFEWLPGATQWSFTRNLVDYDFTQEVEALRQKAHPSAQTLTQYFLGNR